MKILITGGAGFIGSHIADNLIEKGADVTVVDDLSTGKMENVNGKARFIEMDIRDAGIAGVFSENKFDAVYHLAAQMDVRKSVNDPVFDADVNIMGGLNLLGECSRTGVKRFIFASSGGVMYGENEEEKPTEEKHPMPLCPYGCSKLALEFYLNFYRDTYGLDTVILRFGNVYGPRQDPFGEAGVVAIFTKAMLAGKEVKIFGDGEQLRDYVYVGDVANSAVISLDKGSNIYNIGTSMSKSVNDLFGILCSLTGYEKEPVYSPPREGELQISRLDVSKAARELEWTARIDFEEGLKKTVEYFRGKN
jgi:UDP-glucose 4-epimerase